jgi:hypothetical protein
MDTARKQALGRPSCAAELNRQLLKLEVECRMLLLGLGGDDDDSGSA